MKYSRISRAESMPESGSKHFARIADETGVELDRVPNKRAGVSDELFGHATAAEKDSGDLALRAVQRINPNGRRAQITDRFKPLYVAEINISKNCPCYSCGA